MNVQRAKRLGHRPGHYRTSGPAGSAPIQRLVHDETYASLYTSDDWQNLAEPIEVPNPNGDGTIEQSRTIADFLADPEFQDIVRDRWGIDLSYTQVEPWTAVAKSIQTRLLQVVADEMRGRFSEPNAPSTDKAIRKLARGAEFDAELLAEPAEIDTFRTDCQARFAALGRAFRAIRAYTQEDYVLYSFDLESLVQDPPVVPEPRPVFNPVVYMEDDAGSAIGDNMERNLVCVMLAMLYERGYGGTSGPRSRDRVNQLLGNLLEGTDLDDEIDINAGHFNHEGRLHNPQLYQAAEALHQFFWDQQGLGYDIDKNTMTVMEAAGYSLVAAGNSPWTDVPTMLPLGTRLEADQVYIFMIGMAPTDDDDSRGHSNAATVLQAIDRETNIDDVGQFFNVRNEGEDNFGEDPFAYNVRSIWKKD